MSRQNLSQEDLDFEENLQSWINESPEGEREDREEASKMIRECKLSNSISLPLFCSKLTTLPESIGNLGSLQSLNLNDNQLETLPESIGNLGSLQELNLGDNQLATLPESIGNLSSLEYLYLNSSQLATLPESIGNLSSLQRLYLNRNQLTTLPESIGNLGSLQELHLGNNQLTTLPEAIWNLVSVQRLHLNGNQLATLPESIGNLGSLQSLNLNDNQLETLPESIGNLGSLQRLNLLNNQLTNIPESIGNLGSLQELSLNYNRLTNIPESIGNLSSLQRLYLDRNQLTTLPESIFTGQAHNLSISLENNRIRPQEAQRLSQLAQENRIRINLSVYEESVNNTPINTQSNQTVKNSILALSKNEEERQNIINFLSSEEMSEFNRFLLECSGTAGWNADRGTAMSNSLYNLINQMRENETLKTKCLTLASTAFGSCGDRIALAYVQMILSANVTQKPVNEMSVEELFEYAKQEAVTKFLNDKAESRINEIKTRGGGLDEIETYLAYLQASPQLGVNLPASAMLYQTCSNVTNADTQNAITEFSQKTINFRTAEHVYNDNSLKTHPLITEIITTENNRDDLDYSPKKNESDTNYQERMSQIQEGITFSIIAEIENLFARNLGQEFIDEENSQRNSEQIAEDSDFEDRDSEEITIRVPRQNDLLFLSPSDNSRENILNSEESIQITFHQEENENIETTNTQEIPSPIISPNRITTLLRYVSSRLFGSRGSSRIAISEDENDRGR